MNYPMDRSVNHFYSKALSYKISFIPIPIFFLHFTLQLLFIIRIYIYSLRYSLINIVNPAVQNRYDRLW